MQRLPLEWLHRMPQQPRKTAARMLLVPGFFYLTFLQLIREGRILTSDDEKDFIVDGIKIIVLPVWKWLLQ